MAVHTITMKTVTCTATNSIVTGATPTTLERMVLDTLTNSWVKTVRYITLITKE